MIFRLTIILNTSCILDFLLGRSCTLERAEMYYECMEPFKSLMHLWVRNENIAAIWLEKVVTPLIDPAINMKDKQEKDKIMTQPDKNEEREKARQYDYDVQATNIIIYDLPPDVYALVNHQEVAKDIWDRYKLLMKCTELSYQERECRLYNLFDKITMQQVQVNTKFLNALPSEWIKFVTDVKLDKSLYTTNYDQLYAYLSKHERDANEVHITRKRYPDPLALVANSPTLYNLSQLP
nr:hypothetical protein [Tanacetum cinerariifolium]